MPTPNSAPEKAATGRRYFAGGIRWGDDWKQDEFVAGSFWQLGHARNTTDPNGQRAWRVFQEIRVGDWFAIKGYGGRNDLKLHLLGEVKRIDSTLGRIELSQIGIPPFRLKAPRPGAGGRGWFDALLEIKEPAAIQQIFKIESKSGPGGSPPGSERVEPFSPQNVIFFGPPGTGKTHKLQAVLKSDFGPSEKLDIGMDDLRELAAEHNWFEVVAFALHDLGGSASVPELREHRFIKAKNAVNPRQQLSNGLWDTLQAHTVQNSKTVRTAKRTEPLIFDKREDGAWSLVGELPESVHELVDEISSIEEVSEPEPRHKFVTFHQSFSYEDFVEGIRPKVIGGDSETAESLVYKIEEGVLLRAAEQAIHLAGFDGSLSEFCTSLSREDRAAYTQHAPQYAIAIDEINRGNVSRIFGELISLIEPSKRLGADDELIVTLPYSRLRFGVPANLCFLGTMNTADRSVESLDTALRRRFHFREMRPDYTLLDGVIVDGIDIRKLLERINERLVVLRDRDHQIGHAYFLPLKQKPTLDELRQIFLHQIIPLLQEYFYSDYGKLLLVLGPSFMNERRAPAFPSGIAPELFEDLRDVRRHELLDEKALSELSPAAFIKIYEG